MPITEDSVSALLDQSAEFDWEDPSRQQPTHPMTVQPTTEQLRQMAGPQSTDEVTEVHKRLNRQTGRRTFDELALPVPGLPDLEDSTLETETAPGNQPPPATQLLPQMEVQSPGLPLANTYVSPGNSVPIAAAAPGGGAPGVAPWELPMGGQFGGAQPEPYAPPMTTQQMPQQSAAIQSHALPRAPLLVDVTPLSLTVETVQGYCDTIVARNTPVPCERSRAFVTAADNQTTVRIRVSQGESPQFRENTALGEVELSGLRPAPRGTVKIEVTFSLDTDGILNVKASDVATGREAKATLRLIAVPGMEQVADMQQRQQQMPIM
jgi:hypothetical protein